MKTRLIATFAALVLSFAPLATAPVLAESLSEGEVTKVDMSAKKLTIKHGPLENLDMPAMTMVFAVADEAMLEEVAPGDQIRFTAEKVRGQFTVMAIED